MNIYRTTQQNSMANRYQGGSASFSYVKKSSENHSEMHRMMRNLDALGTQSSTADSTGAEGAGGAVDNSEEAKKRRKREIQERNTFKGTIQAKEMHGYLELNTKKKEDNPAVSDFKYDAKEVSSAVQQAKNSLSAGRAVLKAKRKVLELKRELARSKGENKEVMVALSHAKQIERVAKKKKHHLELEELVEKTQKTDEKIKELKGEKEEEGSGFSPFDFIDQAQQKLSDAEDQIRAEAESAAEMDVEGMDAFSAEEMEEMMAEEMSSEFPAEEMPDMDEFSREMSDLSAEALEKLDETMEMLDALEVVDPHMSEEDLEKLKRKHRSSEEKDIVKADMAYLRDMIKLEVEKQAQEAMPMAAGGMNFFSPAQSTAISIDVMA